MAGARLICGSDRFDSSGLFGALIPEKLKGTQIIKPIIMKRFSNVGTNSIILPGSVLEEGVLITAGSLFYGKSEPWTIYKGNPAIAVKKIDSRKAKNNFKNLESN